MGACACSACTAPCQACRQPVQPLQTLAPSTLVGPPFLAQPVKLSFSANLTYSGTVPLLLGLQGPVFGGRGGAGGSGAAQAPAGHRSPRPAPHPPVLMIEAEISATLALFLAATWGREVGWREVGVSRR